MANGAERIRYAIYTRQSNQGLFDFSSCDAQFLTCEKHVKQSEDPSLLWTGHHFKDEDYSGSTLDRPGMRELRKLIGLGELDRVYGGAGIRFGSTALPSPATLSIPNRQTGFRSQTSCFRPDPKAISNYLRERRRKSRP